MQYVLFSKYSGCGNDFILIDHRNPFFPFEDRLEIQKLCHRQKGIGADGIIFLENSASADFKMRIFNSDGSEAEMCGNGLRCLARFIIELGFPEKEYLIETLAGVLKVEYDHKHIKTSMATPVALQKNVPLEIDGQHIVCYTLDTGVPHAVVFVDDLEQIPVTNLGAKIRYHTYFAPKGVNANFVEKISPHEISIRTFERGVEAETLACGTGATAAALAASLQWHLKSPIKVKTRSSDTLEIEFTAQSHELFTHVNQIGPALKVYSGTFLLKGTQ